MVVLAANLFALYALSWIQAFSYSKQSHALETGTEETQTEGKKKEPWDSVVIEQTSK